MRKKTLQTFLRIVSIKLFLALAFTSFGQIYHHHIVDEVEIKRKYGFTLQRVVTTPPDSTTPYETKTASDLSLCGVKRKGVISVSGGQILFDVWQITDNLSCGSNGLDSSMSLRQTQIRFTDNRSTLGRPTKVMWVPYRAINLGVNTLPFRYRFAVKTSDTTTVSGIGASSFQLAFNVGYTWGWSAITTRALTNYSITLGAFTGPATTDLKKNVYKDPSKYVSDQTNATLTYGLNLIVARNNLGLVFALGAERALGVNSNEWIYNRKPFFAFGINTSFGR